MGATIKPLPATPVTVIVVPAGTSTSAVAVSSWFWPSART